jgi:hypothetical protein
LKESLEQRLHVVEDEEKSAGFWCQLGFGFFSIHVGMASLWEKWHFATFPVGLS